MTCIICFHCGSKKPEIFGSCNFCKKLPNLPDQYVLSALLTEQFTSPVDLIRVADNIKKGSPPKVSQEANDLILELLKESGVLII